MRHARSIVELMNSRHWESWPFSRPSTGLRQDSTKDGIANREFVVTMLKIVTSIRSVTSRRNNRLCPPKSNITGYRCNPKFHSAELLIRQSWAIFVREASIPLIGFASLELVDAEPLQSRCEELVIKAVLRF